MSAAAGRPPAPTGYLDGLQSALAAQHAALYVVGALGAQTSASATPDLFDLLVATYEEHRTRRDELGALVQAQGAEPVAAQTAYALPADLTTPEAVTRAGLEVQRACSAAWAYLVGTSPRPERDYALQALKMTAVRELAFRGTPEMFPGTDEYADR